MNGIYMRNINAKIKIGTIGSIVIIVYFIIYVLNNIFEGKVNIISIANTYYIFVALMTGLILLIMKKNEKLNFKKELISFVSMMSILILMSLIKILYYHKYNTAMINGIGVMLFPMLFAFLFINIMDFKQIYNSMVTILIISIIGYIIEIGIQAFSAKSLSMISIRDSYSPFESHMYSGISAGLAAFFCYFRKKKLPTIVSVIFSILTFKRIPIIFTIILLVYSLFSNKANKTISKKIIIFTAVGFSICGFLYTQMLMPNNIRALNSIINKYLNIDLYTLVMGRNVLFSRLFTNGFHSLGLDSTFLFSKDIEMDLVRLYLEVGIVGLLSVSLYFWSLTKNKRYNYIFMFSIFVNLLLSHSLHSPVGWVLKYIVIFTVSLYDNKCFPITNFFKIKM